ncbi:hypothetical protein [Variovorax fucosicus]|uniref:hypothetical protein n=1 Tax=Variovorax fucosicus TaxID=3053517 RepID=UPI0025781DE3|nr:hypothetical protein [Variovorax sp. J22G47]MDM0054998.1 hypothetical protein [Variovorax sp. J22G47]
MLAQTLLRRFLLLTLATFILFVAWQAPIDAAARTQVREDLARAAKVFATARAIGATLSVAQSANVDLKLFGTGVGVSPGQALRPVQEFVDRFAALMLAVSVAFGIQLLLLQIGAHWVVSALLSIAMLAATLTVWRGRAPMPRVLQALLVFMLLVRFAVPLSVAANGLVYKAVMAPEYQSAVATLEQSPAVKIEPGPDVGMLTRAKAWFQRMADAQSAIESLLRSASDWADRMVRLLALFAVQTIVLPLVFLWLFWRACRLTIDSLAPMRVQSR